MRDRPLVIGIGQPWRGDDAAGLEVVARLADLAPMADLCEHHGEGLGLLALWDGRARVVVIDAAKGGPSPGTRYRLTAADILDGTPPAFRGSSHVVGLGEAIGLAEALGRLPSSLIVHAVEGADFTLGAPLSPAVAQSIDALTEAVRADLA